MSARANAPRRDEGVPARGAWSAILPGGEVLRIIDQDGQQAVDTLLYNAADKTQR